MAKLRRKNPGRSNPRHLPRKVFESRQVIVYDDFLPPDKFQEILAFCNSEEYEMVHRNKWRKVWRLHDGLPLQGKTYHYNTAAPTREAQATSYPTKTVLDEFIEGILDRLKEAGTLVGVPGKNWTAMSVAPWVYPAGSGLSLHCDGNRYSGAYTFFVHPRWNINWGGLLHVLDAATKAGAARSASSRAPAIFPPWLNDDAENEWVWDPGLAMCVMPKPNRIVFLSSDAWHMITRVDPNAGHHARVSIAGFFIKKN